MKIAIIAEKLSLVVITFLISSKILSKGRVKKVFNLKYLLESW
jgi:hypothetical protein